MAAPTQAELILEFTRAGIGVAPTEAQKLQLQAWATQSASGQITNDSAFLQTNNLAAAASTDVLVGTYQFFLGFAPSTAGLASLNAAFVTGGAQNGLNAENRFIAQSIALATQNTTAKAAFTASYGALSFADAATAAYNIIVGGPAAAAAGINVANAVAFLTNTANIAYYTAFVKANTGLTAAADIDLAVKAAIVAEILYNANVFTVPGGVEKGGVGAFAVSTNAYVADLADDGVLSADNAAGVNLFISYPGTGAPGVTTALSKGVDTYVGTSNNDTFTGFVDAVTPAESTVNVLDSIDGGAGNDTLVISDAAGTLDVSTLSVKNVETVNLTSAAGLGAAADFSAYAGLTAANVVLNAPAGAQSITAAGTTSVSLTAKAVGANALTVQGGFNDTITTVGQGTGTITVGSVAAPTGAVSVSTTGGYADAALVLGAIGVKGGASVTVNQTATTAAQAALASVDATNFTVTQAAVTVTGTAATTSVTVNQTKAVAAVNSGGTDGVIGVVTGVVTINDLNVASTTKAGVITTVSLANTASAAINTNGLTSLTLNGATGVTIGAGVGNALNSTALTLNLAGGTSAVVDTQAEITKLTVNATAASTLSNFTDANLTALTVSGSKLLTLTAAAGMTGLKTVTVTGAGGLTAAGLNTIASLTKIDTTGATGATTVSIDATKVTYAGGAGVDSVTLVGALPAAASIALGAGNDRLLGATAVAVSTATVIDGGDGVDAIASSLISVGNAAQFKNFEVLNLAETAGSFDINVLTASTISSLELNGGAGGGTYTNVSTAQSLAVTGTSGGTATLSFTNVAGTADAYSIGFAGAVAGTSATALAAVNAGTVAIQGIEAVSINSGGTFNTNAIVLADADARTLAITGGNALNVSFVGGFGAAGTNGLNSIDASTATGAITINTANTGISSTAGLTIKTGTGADVITLDANFLGSITTGTGKDNVDVGLVAGLSGTAVKTTITDLTLTDTLTLKNQGTEVFTATKVDVTAFNSLGDILDSLTAGDGSTNGQIKWFQYLGNTYVVEDNSVGATFAVTDIAVKLTGLIDLSTATGAGTHILTLA